MTEIAGAALGEAAARRLTQEGPDIQSGLTDAEFDQIEQAYGFEFADDHRGFLAASLPVGERWPDWRNGDPKDLVQRLNGPIEGVLFEVEHDVYWHDRWGERPTRSAAAVELARQHLSSVPQLVPLYSHRYLPAGRGTSGHPVLSVHQTDIIYYGMNLLDYVYQEFRVGRGINRSDPQWQPHATVPFWREFLE